MINVIHLHKSYGQVRALRDVSFKIAPGEIIGLLGPNGAGKTTIIKILTGYLQPDEGEAVVDGINVLDDPNAVQSRIGYLPESAPLYPELSVQDYLLMMAELRQIEPDDILPFVSEAVYATGLQDYLTRPIGQLSKGYRQRVGLAQAILHKPRLLILDEPTVGLDPTQIVEIRSLIRRLAQHSTVLFSTHILPEVEALCDRVLMLFHGQMRLDSRLSELAQTNDALLTVDGRPDHIESTLTQIKGVTEVSLLSPANGRATYRISGQSDTDLCPAIYQTAVREGWPVREIRPDVQTLETVFNTLALAPPPALDEEE